MPIFETCKKNLTERSNALKQKLDEDKNSPQPKMTREVILKYEGKIRRVEAQVSALLAFEADKVAQVEFIANPFDVCKSGESASLKSPAGLFSLYFEKPVEQNFLGDDALIIRLTNLSVAKDT
jgi:hypothetical protein